LQILRESVSSVSVYVGEDTPGAVTDLVLSNENSVAVLNWNNPAVGAHNGYYVETSILSKAYPNKYVLGGCLIWI